MADDKKTKTAKEEEAADEEVTETVTEDETEETEEDETESEHTDKDKIDYDAEIEKEKKRGKPDADKAKEAFKKRQEKRGQEIEDDEDESDEDKPLTRKDLADIEQRANVRAQSDAALSLAKGLSTSEKEAELVLARWKNRVFLSDLSLSEQIEEVYAGMNAKKLIGTAKEAVRALNGKDRANKSGTGSHHEGMQDTSEPKLPPADLQAIKAAGFAYNSASKLYEKKLGNGKILVSDPKTKATYIRK